MDTALYTVDKGFPIYMLDCKSSYSNLSLTEKSYAASLIKAGWAGALIDLLQCSPESAGLFLLAQHIFRQIKTEKDLINLIIDTLDLSEEDYNDFLNYFVMIYDNLGNYKSFGDSKFIPRIAEDKFNRIVTAILQLGEPNERINSIRSRIQGAIYGLTKRNAQMGLGEAGISAYYSYNCTEEDAQLVQRCMDANGVSAYNTRLFKSVGEKTQFTIKQASVDYRSVKRVLKSDDAGVEIRLENGDYSELMLLIVKELIRAQLFALNDNERNMLDKYIESFRTGSIDAHKDASRFWIRDKGPIVENYIGFIETYRDPIGVRGEFEAFIAIVNKEMTQKFDKLVSGAEKILQELPWPNEYEKDKFLQPDFTSLDIINFPNSGMPVGINIPNYDDIRQDEGFKNVSLGNVLKARFKDPKANFLRAEDKEVFIANIADSFEIQVGLHELIGHGSGKLFYKKDGQFNFDSTQTRDLKSGGDVMSWYKDAETWDGKFQSIASPFEECRAECVGLYLCSLPNVLSIFGHESTATDTVSDVVYVNWLSMMKSAVLSMEFYTPEQKKWRQAHCQARFVIMQVLLEVPGLVEVREIKSEDGKPDLVIHLNRDMIINQGRTAIGNFLKMLQYYKSTANVEEGSAFFTKYSVLNEQFMHLRQIVLDRKMPRGCTIQPYIDDIFELHEYEASKWGMIQSFQDRFSEEFGEEVEEALFAVWDRDHDYFEY